MRTLALAILLPLAAGPLAACNVGADDGPGIAASGSGGTRSYAVSDFTAIELAGADDVDVRVGPTYSVRAEGAPDELDKLRIDKKGDTLEIGRRHQNGVNWGKSGKLKLFVTLPRLTGTSVAGSGTVAVDRVQGGNFKGEIAGSGNLKLAALAVDHADIDLAGSGSLNAAGTAKSLNVEIAGSGSVDAPALTANSASVSIAGSGGVKTTVNGAANVEIMGSGDVDLGPNAHCTTSKMGSGTVRCGA